MDISEKSPLLLTQSLSKLKAPATPDVSVSKKFSFKKIDRRKKFIFVSLGFVNFCAYCCYSLLAPFFPLEAGRKGASQSIVGFIFGCFEFVIFIASPILGNYISKIGCKFMFVSGVMVGGTCAILFGLLDKCPDGAIFITMCFLCRIVEAIGTAAFVTALFAIMAYEFPDNIITVMGTLETFTGLGMMVGPAVGGALYEIGGYGLPFFVLGSVVILCGLLTSYVMPPIEEANTHYTGSIFTMFKSPLVCLTWLNISVCSISIGYYDPTLAGHLQQFNLSTWAIGLVFLISPSMYALTAPIVGYIGDKKGHIRAMIAVGNIGCVISWFLLGPAPFLPFIPNELYVNFIALVAFGPFLGFTLIPTFKALLLGANSLGMPTDIDTYGKVSGFFNSSFSLGAFLGPTFGGVMVDKFGFPWASVGIAGLLFLGALLMIGYICIRPELPKPPEQDITVDTNDPEGIDEQQI
ncbi:hypothetical protein ACF0H5_007507 [Mactra antiquata]